MSRKRCGRLLFRKMRTQLLVLLPIALRNPRRTAITVIQMLYVKGRHPRPAAQSWDGLAASADFCIPARRMKRARLGEWPHEPRHAAKQLSSVAVRLNEAWVFREVNGTKCRAHPSTNKDSLLDAVVTPSRERTQAARQKEAHAGGKGSRTACSREAPRRGVNQQTNVGNHIASPDPPRRAQTEHREEPGCRAKIQFRIK